MLIHTDAVEARAKTVPALATKTFVSVAPRTDGVLPTAPYLVIHPADGEDSQERVSGPRSAQNPAFTFHIVGTSYSNCQQVTELLKAKFFTAGVPIQINVTGERGRGLRWSSPQPTQVDNDMTPPLIYNVVEVSWISEPV
jgi:hypothetical protein